MNFEQEIINLLNSGCSHITKWFCFNDDNSRNTSVINCIMTNQIYMSFSNEFNDIFDAQLRLCDETIRELAKRYHPDLDVGLVKNFQHTFNNSYIISCFSKNDPTSTNSHNMWGLYGKMGKGFALQYSLKSLHALIRQNKKHYLKHTIRAVSYGTYCPLNFFDGYLEKFLEIQATTPRDSQKKERLLASIETKFLGKKNLHWQYEEEVRIIGTGYLKDTQGLRGSEIRHLPFVNPSKIVLGWDYQSDKNTALYNDLIKCAHDTNTDIGYLDKTVDYENKKFIYLPIDPAETKAG